MVRFLGIQRVGSAGRDRAKRTVPRADVPQHQERGRSAVPAFRMVRTLCALANGVQPEAFEEVFDLLNASSGRPGAANPVGKRGRTHPYHLPRLKVSGA